MMLDNPYFLAVGVVLFAACVANAIAQHRTQRRAEMDARHAEDLDRFLREGIRKEWL